MAFSLPIYSPDGIRSPSQSGRHPTKTCHETGVEEMGTTLRPGSLQGVGLKALFVLLFAGHALFVGTLGFWRACLVCDGGMMKAA